MEANNNSNSYILKNKAGHFIGYLNLRKDMRATQDQVGALLNGSSDMIIESAETAIVDNPFAEFAADTERAAEKAAKALVAKAAREAKAAKTTATA